MAARWSLSLARARPLSVATTIPKIVRRVGGVQRASFSLHRPSLFPSPWRKESGGGKEIRRMASKSEMDKWLEAAKDGKWPRAFGNMDVGYPQPTEEEHSATVIWLHGLGDVSGWAHVSEYFEMPWVKFLFPNAPEGKVMCGFPQWFSPSALGPSKSHNDHDGLLESAAFISAIILKEKGTISAIILKEKARGIPPGRIVLAGVSQGGAVALTSGLLLQVLPSGTVLRRHYTVSGTDNSAPGTDYRRVPDYGAWCLVRTTESLRGVRYRIRYAMSGTDVRVLRQDEPIGGIVGLSTWLPSLVDGDGLGQEVAAKTEVLLCHGTRDTTAKFAWGEGAAGSLSELGVNVRFTAYEDMGHGFHDEEMAEVLPDIEDFLREILPETPP